MVNKNDIIEVLKKIVDPEINIDVWTLGLIYSIEENDNKTKIIMTLTSPMCPYGPQLIEEITSKVSALEGVKSVDIEVTFDPPWNPPEDLRALLGV